MQNSIQISEGLLDLMVDAITKLPYREAQPVFDQLAIELSGPKEQEPKIITN